MNKYKDQEKQIEDKDSTTENIMPLLDTLNFNVTEFVKIYEAVKPMVHYNILYDFEFCHLKDKENEIYRSRESITSTHEAECRNKQIHSMTKYDCKHGEAKKE
jgi:hypothetical protein